MCSREQGFYQTGVTEMPAKQMPLVDLLRVHADDIHSAHGYNKSSTLLSRAADHIVAIEAERDQLRADLAECRRQSVRLYNSGYHAGHHDTVEGCYTHILPCDMSTYHDDVVAALAAKEGE